MLCRMPWSVDLEKRRCPGTIGWRNWKSCSPCSGAASVAMPIISTRPCITGTCANTGGPTRPSRCAGFVLVERARELRRAVAVDPELLAVAGSADSFKVEAAKPLLLVRVLRRSRQAAATAAAVRPRRDRALRASIAPRCADRPRSRSAPAPRRGFHRLGRPGRSPDSPARRARRRAAKHWPDRTHRRRPAAGGFRLVSIRVRAEGEMAFERTPYFAPSTAATRDKATIPNLAAA